MPNPAQHPNPPIALERLPSVKRRTGLSRTHLYRLIADGLFAKPVKLGFVSAWPEGEVSAWIADRIAARDEGGQA